MKIIRVVLLVMALACSVYAGVIHAWRLRHATVRSSLTGGMPQPRGGLTRDSTRPDWSMPLIDNLSHDAVLSRRVNPGSWRLHAQCFLIPKGVKHKQCLIFLRPPKSSIRCGLFLCSSLLQKSPLDTLCLKPLEEFR